ncbi:hypothetical protein ACCO45_002004 [Purpureocillium lilacinum]|uniref:Uncharacterized protein n=1 Tax=Purpureocillium lilacinum TaxID=33203 RepID=A0ACC4EB81_PURLI
MYEAEEKLWEHSPMRVTPDIKNDQPLALLGRFHFVLQQSRRYDAHAYIKITIPSTSSEEIPLSIVPKKTGQSRQIARLISTNGGWRNGSASDSRLGIS